MGFFWVGGDEGAAKQRQLEHVLTEVVSEFWIEWVWMGKENGSRGSKRRRSRSGGINIDLEALDHVFKVSSKELPVVVRT